MKFLLIEPHPDDILLSMGRFLNFLNINKTNEIHAVTMSFASKTGLSRDSKKYFDMKSVRNINFDFNLYSIDQIFYDNCINLISKNPFENHYQIYSYSYPDIDRDIRNRIKYSLDLVKPDIVLCPLGLLHMTHVLCRGNVDKLWPGKTLYFKDLPYWHRLDLSTKCYINKNYNIEWSFIHSNEQLCEKLCSFKELYESEFYMIKSLNDVQHYKEENILKRG